MNNIKPTPGAMRGIVACLMLCVAFMLKAQSVEMEYHWVTSNGVLPAVTQMVSADAEGNVNFDIPANNIPCGANYIVIRTKKCDANGVAHYSPALIKRVNRRPSVGVVAMEYYWDVDPGYGKATPIAITPGLDVAVDTHISVPKEMSNGSHRLVVRAKTEQGWSPVLDQMVTHRRNAVNKIVRVEYFWDVDPGYGKGIELPFTADGDSVSINAEVVPADSLSGAHHLFVRALSEEGQWSPVCEQTINVGIEGSFTLNETLPEGTERNFISITELFEKLLTDDLRDDIDVAVRDGATFEYNATDTAALALATAARAKIEQFGKYITFNASADSVTTLAFTAAEADKNAMMGLLSSFRNENVVITLNGVAYDFNTLNNRKEDICSGDSSEMLDFTSITTDENVSVAWAMKPHADMVVEGYQERGTGNLPAMTLTNHKTVMDYVDYDLALLNGSDTVAVKNYRINVYTRVSEKSYTSFTPQNGASVDPVKQTLTWNSILGADSYRVYITKRLTAEVDSGVVTDSVVTIADVTTTSYTLNVESGYTYDWKVTAYGRCDSLQSVENRFIGRLLSDLSVNFVEVPEYGFSGAPFSISAVVTNNGEGAATESSWNDELYWSTSSSNIASATKLATVTHTGNVAVGESYTVTFDATMPEIDEGKIYLFVATDVNNDVMELNDKNNSVVSTAIDCEPFIMSAEAHAGLTAFYNTLDGDNWTKNKWNIESDNITSENYPGVTFNANGEPTAIALENSGIVGDVTEMTFDLPQLLTLNLAKNALTGDVTKMAHSLPSLTSLNLSYNKLNGLSGALPATITTLNLKFQYRTTSSNFMSMDEFTPVRLMIGEKVDELNNRMVGDLHALEMYNHTNSDFSYHPSYSLYLLNDAGKGTRQGGISYSNATGRYTFEARLGSDDYVYKLGQDQLLYLANSNTWANASAYPVIVSWKLGDSNMDALIDVLDVQHTLNELLGKSPKGFNYSAADLNSDEIHNILDVVKTVNIVLENQNISTEGTNELMAEGASLTATTVGADGNMIVLNSLVEVAAIDLTLSGVSSTQIRQKLSKSRFQVQTRDIDGGVRVVIFSPNGEVIPAGETVLFTMSNYGTPTWIKCADADANEIKAKVSGDPSSVSSILRDQQSIAVSVNDGKLLVKCADAIGMGHVEVYSISGSLIFNSGEVEFKQGLKEFASDLTDEVYIVKVIAEEDCYIGKIKE